MKTYLVTGGTGFIGSGVVEALVLRGDRVRCFDNQWRGTPKNLEHIASKIDFITGDIRDLKTVVKASQGVDCILHLAAINGTEHFYTIPDQILEVSVKGMINVLDACKENRIQDMVLMSTSEVYQTPPIIPTPETVPLSVPDVTNPRYSYGGGKIISELLAIHCGKKNIKNVRIVRPHNVYGPKMGYEHVVPQLIEKISTAIQNGTKKIQIQGSGKETRSFVHIDDMVQGFLLATDKGKNSEIYHVGTLEEISILTLVNTIAECMHAKIAIEPGTLQAGGTLRRCPEIKKIQALGYQPKVDLKKGLTQTVDWYLKNPKTTYRKTDTHTLKDKAA